MIWGGAEAVMSASARAQLLNTNEASHHFPPLTCCAACFLSTHWPVPPWGWGPLLLRTLRFIFPKASLCVPFRIRFHLHLPRVQTNFFLFFGALCSHTLTCHTTPIKVDSPPVPRQNSISVHVSLVFFPDQLLACLCFKFLTRRKILHGVKVLTPAGAV